MTLLFVLRLCIIIIMCLIFQMARKKVNDYKIGRNIPYHLKLSDQAVPQTLEQKIDLKGVKDANFITILREPAPQGLL